MPDFIELASIVPPLDAAATLCAPLDALAVVAGHITNETESFIVMFEGAFYAAKLRRGKDVTLRGLHVWHPDAELRAAGRAAEETPRGGVFTQPATRVPEMMPWDPERPLVTGSSAKRRAAAMKMMPAFKLDEYSLTDSPSEKPVSPELMATLLAAAHAPENSAPAFASVRKTL